MPAITTRITFDLDGIPRLCCKLVIVASCLAIASIACRIDLSIRAVVKVFCFFY